LTNKKVKSLGWRNYCALQDSIASPLYRHQKSSASQVKGEARLYRDLILRDYPTHIGWIGKNSREFIVGSLTENRDSQTITIANDSDVIC